MAHFQLGKIKVRVPSDRGRTGTALVLPEQLVGADEGSTAQAVCAGWCYSSRVLNNSHSDLGD